MICFACGKEIEDYPCSFCGYDEEELDTIFICPNLDEGTCIITENVCMDNDNYMECKVKLQAEKESFF